jgi:hypothetical protein
MQSVCPISCPQCNPKCANILNTIIRYEYSGLRPWCYVNWKTCGRAQQAKNQKDLSWAHCDPPGCSSCALPTINSGDVNDGLGALADVVSGTSEPTKGPCKKYVMGGMHICAGWQTRKDGQELFGTCPSGYESCTPFPISDLT